MLEMVEEPSRRRDEDVGAAAERRLLRSHGDPAENGGAPDGREARQLLTMLVDLRRQLARGREHESACPPARLADQAIQDRQQEGGGLAAAGHRAGEDVAPPTGRGDGVLLDGRGNDEAQRVDCTQELGVKVERRERHGTDFLSISSEGLNTLHEAEMAGNAV